MRGEGKQKRLPRCYEKKTEKSSWSDHSYTLPPVGSLRYRTHTDVEEMRNVVFLLFPGRASRNLEPIKHPESWGHWGLKKTNIISSKGQKTTPQT